MASSGSESTSKVTPWGPIGENLKLGLKEARSLYNDGDMVADYYPKSTYIGPDEQERQGLRQIQKLAERGNPLMPEILQQSQSLIGGGGLTDRQNRWMQPLTGIASGNDDISTAQLGQAYKATQRPSAAQRNLGQMASGQMVGQSNPHLMGVLGRAADEATDATSGLFSGAGRYGSGAHQGTVARERGRIFSEGLSGQMNQDLQNQMAATGQIDSARQGLLGQQLGAAGQIAGVQGANIANRAASANSIQNILSGGNQEARAWAGMAPEIRDMQFGDAEKLIGVGATQRGESQAKLQADMDKYYYNQNKDTEALKQLLAMSTGQNYATTTQTAPRGSPIAGILGGGMAGAQMGGMFGPWGSLFGGLGGGLLGGFP